MIPDDSLNEQLLEKNQIQRHLPPLSLPTPILINLVVFPWLFWLAWVLLLVVYGLVLVFSGLLLFFFFGGGGFCCSCFGLFW